MHELKKCKTCGQRKPKTKEHFAPGGKKGAKDGFCGSCRKCRSRRRSELNNLSIEEKEKRRSEKLGLRPDGSGRKCTSCKKSLPWSDFYECKHATGTGHHSQCKKCTLALSAKIRDSASGCSRQLRRRCKQRAKNKGLEYSLTDQWILERVESGVCEVTGMRFVMEGRGSNPRSPSIDRINPALGYTESNCRVVVWQLNAALNVFDMQSLMELAEALVSRSKDRAGKG